MQKKSYWRKRHLIEETEVVFLMDSFRYLRTIDFSVYGENKYVDPLYEYG